MGRVQFRLQAPRRLSDEAGQGLPLSPRRFLRYRHSASAALRTGFTKPNAFTGVVNAVRIDVDGTPFAAREHRNFARSATKVAAASLIENWIDG
jgi:hypothetical protein